jgi:hypothetical protein
MEYGTRLSEETRPIKRAASLLAQAEQAAQDGNLLQAYQLSLQATEAAPHYAPAWALRAEFAPSLEEKVACQNRLHELQPNHDDYHHRSYYFLKELFERDPALAYLNETQDLYHVVNKDMMVLRIPKKRTVVQPYPPERPTPLTSAVRWLSLALFGLLLAGVPTLIFAPLAARSALKAAESSNSHADRAHSLAVEIGAVILFGVACFFTLLFVLHIT